MYKILALSVCCLALFLGGCRIYHSFLTHQAVPHNEFLDEDPAYIRIFADLRGNNEDYMISAATCGDKLPAILVSKMDGKVVSQINPGQRVRSLRVLEEPGTKQKWLFFSVNDQKKVWLAGVRYGWQVPLQREDFSFESITRNDAYMDNPKIEWWGNIYPDILEDIDGDGRLELVCRAFDGYTANPRGLVVYDFSSRQIKWRYELNTSLTGVLFDDFDGDGKKEFVCSSVALKNSRESKNGLDDENGWLLVLDSNGKKLYQEKAVEGYGEIHLHGEDTNDDGRKEILARTTTWGAENVPNSVSILRWNGSVLLHFQDWKLYNSLERAIPEFLFELEKGENKRIVLVDKASRLIVLDKDLKPVEHHYKGFVRRICAVEDLNQDGDKEILLQTKDGSFEVLDASIHARARINIAPEQASDLNANIVSTGYGEDKHIAIYCPSGVAYYHYRMLPWYQLVYRTFAAMAIPLSLLLLGVVILLLIHNHRRRKLVFTGLNSLNQGFMVLGRKDRIVLYNKYIRELRGDDSSSQSQSMIKNLKDAFPQVYSALLLFRNSKADSSEFSLNLGRKLTPHIVKMFNLHGFTKRYLITFVPVFSDSDRMADQVAWADIARRLSHNVRRHITNVILALSPLQESAKLDEQGKGYIAIIRDEIEKIRVFTHAFQRFTEMSDYQMDTQDVIPSVEHCISRINIPENIHLIKNWGLQSIHTYIEPIRFEEALGNVIINALEAMPEGGNLHISVKHFPLHSSPQGALTVLVEVEDSGKGIPARYRDEIWRAFFTTKESGTGIGLPESRKIINSMGGEILVQSEEGVGTVVSLWLKGGN